MCGEHRNGMAWRISRTIVLGVSTLLSFLAIPAVSRTDDQQAGYVVVWKSRYNDRNYRSEWYYAERAVADSVADELRQFHAFIDVRVVTLPLVINTDGISAKLTKDAQAAYNFASRGTGAFTVTDLWNYGVPGGGGGGDAQVISLRRGDSSTASTSSSGVSTTQPVAPAGGGQQGERLVEREDVPKGQKAGTTPALRTGATPTPAVKREAVQEGQKAATKSTSTSTSKTVATPTPRRSFGGNEQAVKEEILRAKSEVLQQEKQRLDKERARINQTSSRDGEEHKNKVSNYRNHLEDYKELVGHLQRDVESHQAKYNPAPSPSRSLASGSRPAAVARPTPNAATTGGPFKVSAHSTMYGYNLSLGSFETRKEAVKKATDFDKSTPNMRIKILDRNGKNVGW
jgi:hypothetical protein